MKKYFFKLHLATLFVFLLFFTTNKPATAGWSEVENGTTERLEGIWGNSGEDVFAVGGNGTILHYNGMNWSEMESGTTNDLEDIWGTGENDVFAVGENGTMIHYNGKTWSKINSGTSKDLDSVWGSSQNDIFVTGNGFTRGGGDYINFILHYNGNTWSEAYRVEADVTRPERLYDIWGSSGINVFVVGHYSTIFYYNGSSWSKMKSGIVTNFSGIWGSSENDVYTVGWNRYADNKICHYDGNTWSEIYSDESLGALFDVWGSSNTDVFAVGGEGAIFHYDGITWSEMNSMISEHLYAVWGNSGEDVFAVGENGTILHYDGINICTAEKVYGEHSEKTELLRNFRDEVLSKTSEGQELIKLYYQWSPVIVNTMEEDGEFKEEVKELLDGVLGLIGGKAE